MNLFARILVRAERWIESIDKERDQLAQSIDGTALRSDVHIAFVRARLGVLEQERAEALQLLADLQVRRFHPALMFPVRPMLKMPRASAKRKSA